MSTETNCPLAMPQYFGAHHYYKPLQKWQLLLSLHYYFSVAVIYMVTMAMKEQPNTVTKTAYRALHTTVLL